MKKIICFGDSNTFGFNPKTGSRYDSNTRWTSVLAKLLANSFEVVEEGCNNRTGFFINPDGAVQSGQKYLPVCLKKNKKFDIFILALGTNDLQKFFKINEQIVNEGLINIIALVRKFCPNTRIIIIPPVLLSENILNGYFKCQFDESSIKASVCVQKLYESAAQKENCEFLDFNKFVTPSAVDGLHFDEESHKIIAEKVLNQVLSWDFKHNDDVKIVDSCIKY